MKKIIVICLIVLMSIESFAIGMEMQEDSSVSDMFEYKLIPQEMKDVSSQMEAFFGEDIDKLEKISDTNYQSADGRYVFVYDPQTGYFEMNRPSNIHRYYRIDNEPITFKNPYPSDVEGLYLPDEAAELGETFLSEGLGMDISHLIVADIEAMEPNNKERSRMYRIVYQYSIDEKKILSWPVGLFIQMWVSDNGVEGIDCGRAVVFERTGVYDIEKILDEDALRKQLSGYFQSQDFELCYQPVREDKEEKLIPAWNWVTDSDQALSYNAFTGEEIEFF